MSYLCFWEKNREREKEKKTNIRTDKKIYSAGKIIIWPNKIRMSGTGEGQKKNTNTPYRRNFMSKLLWILLNVCRLLFEQRTANFTRIRSPNFSLAFVVRYLIKLNNCYIFGHWNMKNAKYSKEKRKERCRKKELNENCLELERTEKKVCINSTKLYNYNFFEK